MSKTKTSKRKNSHRVPVYRRPWMVLIFFLAMAVAVVLALLFLKPRPVNELDPPTTDQPSHSTPTTLTVEEEALNPMRIQLNQRIKLPNTKVKTPIHWLNLPVHSRAKVSMTVF